MPVTTLYGMTLTVEAALSAATGQTAVLNANSTFESGISSWTPNGSTISQSAVWAQQGTYSMRIVPDGVSVRAYAESERMPVIVGQSYVAAGVVNSPTGAWAGNFSFSVNWFDSGGVYLSTSSADVPLVGGVESRSTTFTAPASAAYASLSPTVGGTPPASLIVYVDMVTLSTASTGFGAWGSGLWDSATWGPDEVWQDVTPYVRSISIDRRFTRDVQVWESGGAVIVLDNRDARFSPSNTSGPYVSYGVTGVRPWRPVRVRATWAGVIYDVYRGYALEWQETYVEPFPNGGDAVMTVSCVDEWAALARVDGLEQTPVGAGELSGVRVHRILNNAGHGGARMIDPGNVTLQATDLSANTVEELRLTTDSEGGGLFINKAGAVVFQRSTALVDNSRSNAVQAVYGDGPGELPYSDVKPAYDGDLTVNIVSWSRVGGTTQTLTDENSRALYKDKRSARSDLICETDLQVFSLAGFYLQRFSRPEDRIASVEIRPRANPAVLFPKVLTHEVRDLVRAVRRPPGGITVTRDCHIAGIAHQITGDNWITTLTLWSATVYQSVGRWDVALWGSATWF